MQNRTGRSRPAGSAFGILTMIMSTDAAADSQRIPPPAVVGAAVLPFGLVAGFTITALPFLLTHAGVSLGRVATISAIVMSPTFWGFLLQPLMDTGLTRRAYGWLSAGVAAVCLGAALMVLSPAHLAATTALLLAAELATVMYSGAIGGWTAAFTPDRARGAVSGWTNVANLGGGAAGSMVVMELARRVALPWLALSMALAVLAGALPTLWFPEPRRSSFRFRQLFTDALRAIWRASRTRECLIGFCLFLAPVSAEAAINLFSGLGGNFHAPSATVIWVTGAGCAITSSLGALLGGYAADRISRGYLYLCAGMGTGVCALAMAFAPRVPLVFIVGVLAYNGMAGIAYAAFNALGFEIVGQHSPVASTQLGLFAASTNLAIVYMTWADGRGFQSFGARGLMLTDAVAALAAGVVLMAWLGRRLLRQKPGGAREQPLPALTPE